MSLYRADLTGAHSLLIAHLLPGDVLTVATSEGVRVIGSGDDWLPWHAIYDDAYGLRICRFGTEQGLAQNVRVRQRPPITAAARAVRHGGAVYVTHELRQETNRHGEAYGPLVVLPARHVLIETDELATTGVDS